MCLSLCVGWCVSLLTFSIEHGVDRSATIFFQISTNRLDVHRFFFRVVGIFGGLVWSLVGWKGESSGGYCKQSSPDCQALPNSRQGVGFTPWQGGWVSPCVVNGEGIDS